MQDLVSPMNRIDKLLAAMTLEEKIGQLNMVAAGYAVTGPVLASGTARAFAPGESAVFSTFGEPRTLHAMQKIAVKRASRAGGCFSYRRRLGLSASSPPYI